ncbi:MAG: mechanosensitive ion channel family protein [Candidatus Paceibacterota bacterium]
MQDLNQISLMNNSVTESIFAWLTDHGPRIVLVLVAAFLINRFSGIFIERLIRRIIPANNYNDSEIAERKREDTLIRISVASLRVVVWIMVILILLSEIGINIGPLIAAAGVVGLAFGFGGQYLIKDLISGFFIILENQYRIGDVVCFDGTCGLVEDITLRSTILRDLDGVVHHVPHGTISRVSNQAKEFARVNINLGVSYSEDLEKVIKVINEVGNTLAEDELWKEHIIKPIQFLRVADFADSSVVVKVLGETVPMQQWAVAGEFRKRIKIAFDQAKIEIPFPQRVMHTVTK